MLCEVLFSKALSSAEAEIISIVETAKEMVSLGMLLQTMIQGIALNPLGMPLQTTGEMGLRMFNDAKAAISMGKMGTASTPFRTSSQVLSIPLP